jgi:hypothetical protein
VQLAGGRLSVRCSTFLVPFFQIGTAASPSGSEHLEGRDSSVVPREGSFGD